MTCATSKVSGGPIAGSQSSAEVSCYRCGKPRHLASTLPAMLLAIHHLDYHEKLGVHEGKPQLLLMHRYFLL